jgi:hypothetical protein
VTAVVKRKPNRHTWYRADLHLHTPASSDYQETGVGIIDILRRAEAQGLDILALTDHNTVNGYAGMLRDIDRLSFLQASNRATPDELRLLNEYRRLLDKLLVLPGFEFTATFGFHILGIFSPSTPIRVLEHLLLSLNVPSQALDAGSSEVGASSDVLTAYRAIYEAGGLCIAAHANSAHGVAMFGVEFGGQTRIAYTQDRHLHALEITDLTRNDKRSTARFFDGSKPEYPRRMRCIQGSDAHRLDSLRDKRGTVNPGVGERITEFALPERSFEALLELFQGADMTRTTPKPKITCSTPARPVPTWSPPSTPPSTAKTTPSVASSWTCAPSSTPTAARCISASAPTRSKSRWASRTPSRSWSCWSARFAAPSPRPISRSRWTRPRRKAKLSCASKSHSAQTARMPSTKA